MWMRRGQKQTGPSGAARAASRAAAGRSGHQSRFGRSRATVGWMTLCFALLLVYLAAVLTMAYILVAIDF